MIYFKRLIAGYGAAEGVAISALILIVVAAAFPNLLAPFDPLRTGAGRPVLTPSWPYLLGTDELGRDVFSRIVWGARISVLIAVSGTLFALVAGACLGSITATRKNMLGLLVTLLINLVLVFPGVVLAVALATVIGPSAFTTAIVLAVLYTPPFARVVATAIEVEYGKSYVSALQVLGAGTGFILVRGVARVIAPTVLTFALVILSDAVLLEAALSFIGVGVQPPTPSWGNIVAGGRPLMSSGRWWVAGSGGVMIVIFALAVNIIGDAYSRSPTERNVVRRRKSPAAAPLADAPLLRVQGLTITIPGHYGNVAVVDDVSFDIAASEVVSLIGESGSGKSLMARAILGILPIGAVATGQVWFKGTPILGQPAKKLRGIRGSQLAFLPQDAMASLNPVLKIGTQMALVCNGNKQTPTELLDLVRLPAARVLDSYPHELSGGQCQRVALAIALARRPQLLVADEPTTALDVSVQAEIFQLIEELRARLGFSMLLISHDLALVANVAERINVIYAGRLVEQGPARVVLTQPTHPYTLGLLRSITSLENRELVLYSVPGMVPGPKDFAAGCRFSGRCFAQTAACVTMRPATQTQGDHVRVCHASTQTVQKAAA